MKAKPYARVRYSNRFKCLLCYVVAFALPLVWQWAALAFIYPYKLAGTAPNAAQTLMELLPFLQGALQPLAQAATAAANATPDMLRAALAAREQAWFALVCGCLLCAWLLTLVLQLVWRFTRRAGIATAQATRRAIRAYRLWLLVIGLVALVFAALLWLMGVRRIPGVGVWDGLCYFAAYGLCVLAAAVVSRLAAPPALSGRHGYFKRL